MSADNKGSYFARKLKNGWCVYLQRYVNGVRQKHERVPEVLYPKLQIRPDMTYPEVQEAIKRFNQLKTVEHRKMIRAAKRVEEKHLTHDLYFTETDVQAFMMRLQEKSFGSERHVSKLKSHFRFVQEMVIELAISPDDYSDRKEAFYKYLLDKKLSVDYSNKILRVLNEWGQYISRRYKGFFEQVPYIPERGTAYNAIKRAQAAKKDPVRRASEPLTLDVLKEANASSLEEAAKNYLHATLWLGLRPSEVKMILSTEQSDETWETYHDEEVGLDVLMVKQDKLADSRPKLIPLKYKDQQKAVKNLVERKVKVPHSKTIKKYVGAGYDQYCGRKGFTDHMLALGEEFIYASMWLGHASLRMTTKHYKDKTKVFLKRKKRAS